MTKKSAVNFLKYLHEIEDENKENLFLQELRELAEEVRKEFIKAYNK